jgi:hypothetical protein
MGNTQNVKSKYRTSNAILRIVRHFFKALPKEGSYIELPVKYQFGTCLYKGIVGHHNDRKHYFIKTETSTLCCIKP